MVYQILTNSYNLGEKYQSNQGKVQGWRIHIQHISLYKIVQYHLKEKVIQNVL